MKNQLPSQRTAQPIKSKNSFLPIYSDAPNSFQIDLTFFNKYTNQNNGYYVLFTAININTRFVYAYASKNKTMDIIFKFLTDMENKNEIDNITCDKGSEFVNNKFISFCDDNNIGLFLVKGDSHKLGIINRFHRTLKEKITKYFIAYDTVNWVDAIDDIIKNYNNTFNRGIGTTPNDMNGFDEINLIEEKKAKTEEIRNKSKFNLNNKIRILEDKKLFDDKMTPKYSNDIYDIVKMNKNNMVVVNDGKERTIKKSKAKIISNDTQNFQKINPSLKPQQVKANEEHKIEIQNKKAGVESMNILTEPRIRKANPKYNS